MALRDDRKFEGWNAPVAAARPREGVISVGDSELTDERFLRSVALALRVQWEGADDHSAETGNRPIAANHHDPAADWSEFRAESAAAILAFLDELGQRGFRVVRKDN